MQSDKGLIFWYNIDSKETTWENPYAAKEEVGEGEWYKKYVKKYKAHIWVHSSTGKMSWTPPDFHVKTPSPPPQKPSLRGPKGGMSDGPKNKRLKQHAIYNISKGVRQSQSEEKAGNDESEEDEQVDDSHSSYQPPPPRQPRQARRRKRIMEHTDQRGLCRDEYGQPRPRATESCHAISMYLTEKAKRMRFQEIAEKQRERVWDERWENM